MSLTDESPKYWAPLDRVTDYVASLIKPGELVVEVGPAMNPFHRADVYVDLKNDAELKNFHICDVCTQPLPFKDKEVDFIYARHIVEDLYNPFYFCQEMNRVAKRGYIETPSPFAELARGVDGKSPPYRGYIHHRFLTWVFAGKELRLAEKLPIVEYCRFDEEAIEEILKQDKYWNSYFLWEGELAVKHRRPSIDYEIIPSYPLVLMEAFERSKDSTDGFFSNLEQAMKDNG